ncbi:hypothetical protein RMSM_06813 [Rhodopirellula maiorica SM1]|uniref:Uncharacterized protein n=2 Tax=Novipirellula TaxID=2795426 RepID=M5RLN2_9BACT|nr:hypothetical protein RMSM_06813 [Rhodopirellula maiorica SM1]
MAIEAASFASQMVGELASSVSSAVGFDEVLQSGSADDEPIGESKLRSMIDQVAAAIRSRLEAAGIGVNPPVEVAVSDPGQAGGSSVTVSSAHTRAAEIESMLMSEPEIVDQLQRIRTASNIDRIVVSDRS